MADATGGDCRRGTAGRFASHDEVPIESISTAEELLSIAMNNASLRDRNAIHEEIHGVRCLAIRETQESVAKALNDFQAELDKDVHSPLKTTYNIILSKRRDAREEVDRAGFGTGVDPISTVRHNGNSGGSREILHRGHPKLRMIEKNISYCKKHYAIDDPFFRLRFLRCELFDIRKAVIRYCKYLNFVYELWGTTALESEIRLSDFTRSDSKLFRKGYFQLLPFRDRSGRRIMTLLGGMGQDVDPVSRAKAIFYVLDAATRDSVESQKMGTIMVMEGSCWEDGIDGSFKFPHEDMRLMKLIVSCVPSRIVAIHNCWPDAPVFRFLAKIIAVNGVVSSMDRLRLKFQVGDVLEMRYNLKSHGIPIHLLARTESGTIKLINHNAWVKTRKLLEQGGNQSPESDAKHKDDIIVECPLTNDIVFRQGIPYWDNPGNSVFRDLILEYWGKKQALDENTQRGRTINVFSADAATANNNNNNNQSGKMESDRHLEFRDWLIEEVLTRLKGRFLEWNKDLKAFVVLTETLKIQKKVSVSIYNCRKKASAVALLRKFAISETRKTRTGCRNNPPDIGPCHTSGIAYNNSGLYSSVNGNSASSDDRAYLFLAGGPPSATDCCFKTSESITIATQTNPPRKRSRVDTTNRDARWTQQHQ